MNIKKIIITLICLGLFLVSCKEGDKSSATKARKVTPDVEARTVYMNTALIKVSVIMKMMASFGQAMAKSMGGEDEAKKNIDKFDSEFGSIIDSVMPLLDGKFDSLKQAKPKAYDKLFNGKVLQKGRKIIIKLLDTTFFL